jgi:hemerythrin
MKKSGYKEQEGHKREHTKIINDLVTMYWKLNKWDLSVTIDILWILSPWLTHHIHVVDRSYLDHMKLHISSKPNWLPKDIPVGDNKSPKE